MFWIYVYCIYTIAGESISIKMIATLTATCIRTNSIMAVLVTPVTSLTTFINVWNEEYSS